MSDVAEPARMTAPALTATDLRKSFRIGTDRLQVLHGVSVELRAGEAVALMGASGSGKSTLLQLLGLMDRADAGTIAIAGEPVDQLRGARAAAVRAEKVGFVFQQFQLLHELSALQNVLLPRRLACGMSWWSRRGEERARATRMLAAVGLADRVRHRPAQLSGGEQQRVAIARALVSEPPLLLADEPTGNLDRGTGEEILALLLSLAREQDAAVLLATHDHDVAAACDRLVRLEDGRLAE